MVDNSKVRQLYPSILFFFARLGASIGSFSTHCPLNEGFVPSGSSFGFVVADLHPLLHQFLNWFKEMMDEREVVSEVRFSELKTGLLSSGDPVKAKGDTIASGPSSSRRKEIKPFSCP